MANFTFFMDKPAEMKLDNEIVIASKKVDFSLTKPIVAGTDTADTLVIPAGAVLKQVGIRTDKVNTGATAQLQLTDNAGNELLATAVLGVAPSVRLSAILTTKYFASANSVRMVPSIVNFTDAKITVFAEYFVPPSA